MVKLDLKKRGNTIELNGNPLSVSIYFKSGNKYNRGYDRVKKVDVSSYKGYLEIEEKGGRCKLIDTWKKEDGFIKLKRTLQGEKTTDRFLEGVQIGIGVPLLVEKDWEFFIPGVCYRSCPLEKEKEGPSIIEERLPYPLVLAYDETDNLGISFMRTSLPDWSQKPQRQKDDRFFFHATDIGSMGFERRKEDNPASIISYLPYREGPTSRSLNENMQSISAFIPLNCDQKIEVSYELRTFTASNYGEACLHAYESSFSVNQPEPVDLPFSIKDTLKYRVKGLADLSRDWKGFTGFDINFNPRVGPTSSPTSYGRDFNELDGEIHPVVLEYGFTGRQLNNAYLLMYLGRKWGKPEWIETGEKVIESYIDRCVYKSGFLYTLYDVERNQPIHPFGDEVGAKLHYGVKGAASGNYLRNMTEAAYDLTLCYQVENNSKWLEVAEKFGRFLKENQNDDGSWYRAYSPEGEVIDKPEEWFGGSDKALKASTAAPIPFLIQLEHLIFGKGYLKMAEKAGKWVLENIVKDSDYCGGTLDNSNVVDKESMGTIMSSLLALFEETKKKEYLRGARKAGGLALTWNYLWDVPFESGSRLASYNFQTRGWGGIDILWGGSVVDIYSLCYIRDWFKLAELTEEDIFRNVAKMIINGIQQLMAYPDNLYGLKAPGMQEEGFACSNLGMDQGLIKKGDTWGSLGWIYGISTYGILQVLSEDLI